MNVSNLYRKLRQILVDSNMSLTNKGLNKVDTLNKIPAEIEKLGEINRLPYFLNRDIINIYASDFKDATVINNWGFSNYTSLTSITISDSVRSIGNDAFRYCTSLTSVTIGDSVTSIGSSAFSGCTNLTSITIPDSVTIINNYAFYNCKSLVSVTIGSGISKISPYAFYGCESLKTIVIGGRGSIENSAFNGCTNVENIYIKSVTPPFVYSTISLPQNATIHVPIGSGDAYKSATNWSSFANKIVEDIEI